MVFLLLLLAGRVNAQVFDQAVVVSAVPLAFSVEADVMRDGGNTVDAAVSPFFMLAVTYGTHELIMVPMPSSPENACSVARLPPSSSKTRPFKW